MSITMGWRRATASSRRVRPRFQAMSLSKAGRMSSFSWRAMVLMSSWMDMEVQSAPAEDGGPGARWGGNAGFPEPMGNGFRIAARRGVWHRAGQIFTGQFFCRLQHYAEN